MNWLKDISALASAFVVGCIPGGIAESIGLSQTVTGGITAASIVLGCGLWFRLGRIYLARKKS